MAICKNSGETDDFDFSVFLWDLSANSEPVKALNCRDLECFKLICYFLTDFSSIRFIDCGVIG